MGGLLEIDIDLGVIVKGVRYNFKIFPMVYA